MRVAHAHLQVAQLRRGQSRPRGQAYLKLPDIAAAKAALLALRGEAEQQVQTAEDQNEGYIFG